MYPKSTTGNGPLGDVALVMIVSTRAVRALLAHVRAMAKINAERTMATLTGSCLLFSGGAVLGDASCFVSIPVDELVPKRTGCCGGEGDDAGTTAVDWGPVDLVIPRRRLDLASKNDGACASLAMRNTRGRCASNSGSGSGGGAWNMGQYCRRQTMWPDKARR